VDPPDRRERRETKQVRERQPARYRRPNYLLMEVRNSALGRAGEQFVLDFERARLIATGRPRLADRVEQVSLTRGDFEGFDILSFDTAGAEQLIEVKTTRYGAYTPFYVTRNELDRSNEDSDRYHLYRVFAFRKEPKLFRLPGPVDRSCGSIRPSTSPASAEDIPPPGQPARSAGPAIFAGSRPLRHFDVGAEERLAVRGPRWPRIDETPSP
jgi:hypothetical protein